MSRTVKVKIAVAVDPAGKWNASGFQMVTGATSVEQAMDLAIDGVGEGEDRFVIQFQVCFFGIPIPIWCSFATRERTLEAAQGSVEWHKNYDKGESIGPVVWSDPIFGDRET